MTDVKLGDVARRINDRVKLLAGVAQIPAGDYLLSLEELRAQEETARAAVLEDLLALALKYQETAGDAAALAIVQLCRLGGELLAMTSPQADQLFAERGVDLRRARQVTGAEPASSRPVDRASLAAGGGVLAVLKK